MATLTEERIAQLLEPYLSHAGDLPPNLFGNLSDYLDLLIKWNSRTNLTSIREPEEIVTRHFGESLFAAAHLQRKLSPTAELLDFGSGAGFPGIPIKLLIPGLRICLAESQGKKASFLREVARMLSLDTEIWNARVEDMPPYRQFGCIAMRAVDQMLLALEDAQHRITANGFLCVFGSAVAAPSLGGPIEEFLIPGSHLRRLYLCHIA